MRCARIRAKEIAGVQEPITSLNPVYTVGEQIAEVLAPERGARTPRGALPRRRDGSRSCKSPPERRVNDYPHQFSGGMPSA